MSVSATRSPTCHKRARPTAYASVPPQTLPFTKSERLQQRYTIDALISENHNLHSRVYRGRVRETGEVVAIKELGYAAGDHRSLQLAKLEVGVLFKVAKCLSTQFIIRRLESFWDEAHFRFYVVLPWFRGETVYERIVSSRAGRLEERTARRIFAQMVTAVKELHRVGITHRDIKPANMLMANPRCPPDSQLNTDGRASRAREPEDLTVLADFGLATAEGLWDPFRNRRVGTTEYLAPEMLGGSPQSTPAVDVWALGVVLYNMLSGTPPFNPASPSIEDDIRRGNYMLPRRYFRGVSSEARDVIRACMHVDPAQRPTAEDLSLVPWVRRGLADVHDMLAPATSRRPPPLSMPTLSVGCTASTSPPAGRAPSRKRHEANTHSEAEAKAETTGAGVGAGAGAGHGTSTGLCGMHKLGGARAFPVATVVSTSSSEMHAEHHQVGSQLKCDMIRLQMALIASPSATSPPTVSTHKKYAAAA